MKRHHMLFLAVFSSLAAAPSATHAQAFGLNELGSCAFARGFAVTSSPCKDASTIFWNPGAAAGMKGNSVLVGAAGIGISAKFTRDSARGEHDADVPLAIVPHLFVNRALNDRMAVGLGVYVPYGLTSQWEDNFPGRFLAKKAAIQSIYIQPNFAISIKGGKWKFGGGPVFAMSSVELIQSADLADQIATVDSLTVPTTRNIIRYAQLGIAKKTEFARATLKGSTTGLGINIGGMGQLSTNWTFGFRYLSDINMKYDDADATFKQIATGITVPVAGPPLNMPAGTLLDTLLAIRSRFCTAASGSVPNAPGAVTGSAQTCSAVGLLGDQKVKTNIIHPDQIQFGFAYSGFKTWTIAVDYSWTGWKKFGELPVDFANDNVPTCRATIVASDPVCDFNALDKIWTATSASLPAVPVTLPNGAAGSTDAPLLEDYNNTSAIRVGVEKELPSGWLVRLGFSGVAAASPDETVTPLLPEQDRTYWSIGSAFPIMKDKMTLDATYGFVLGSGRRGRIEERLSRAQTGASLNSGIYNLSANVLSLSLKATF